MNDIYSEFFNGNRKATVTLISRSWDRSLNVWEVTMYVNDRVIQRSTVMNESSAENLAEDFVMGGNSSGPSLLNESISNG